MQVTTLCYLEKENSYLMLFRNKKENDENLGKWIGVGGKVKPNETITSCLIREVYEETSLLLNSYTKRGIITFIQEGYVEEMHLFTSKDFSGVVNFNCNEGTLRWIDKKDIFNLSLWEGDKIFLKRLLEDDSFFKLKLEYDKKGTLKGFSYGL